MSVGGAARGEDDDDEEEEEDKQPKRPERCATARPLRVVRIVEGPCSGDGEQAKQPGIFFAPEDASLDSLGPSVCKILRRVARDLQQLFAREDGIALVVEGPRPSRPISWNAPASPALRRRRGRARGRTMRELPRQRRRSSLPWNPRSSSRTPTSSHAVVAGASQPSAVVSPATTRNLLQYYITFTRQRSHH
mmetsp:Transcript_52178/g.167931  ORF Transcript_52178/g.167931 Transcript_52178/m.167931 type:complete len:192 (+) Transcript_52178:59-634(+)